MTNKKYRDDRYPDELRVQSTISDVSAQEVNKK